MKEVKKDKVKGIVTLVTGFFTAVMGFLATMNIEFAWLSSDSIDAFGVMLVAGVLLALNIYAVWKNTYTTKKSQDQNDQLYKSGNK